MNFLLIALAFAQGPYVRLESSSCGTIVHYDKETRYAYVVGCGHPFKDETKILVEVWVGREKQEHDGELLVHEWNGGIHDLSLTRFKPDFIPKTCSIAPLNWNPDPGRGKEIDYISVGCDGYTSPSEYKVRYLWREKRLKFEQLACEGESLGGRSGGALLKGNMLIGICSRKSKNRIYYSSSNQLYTIDKKYHFIFGNTK